MLHLAAAYLSPMCCGDNFCCAVKTDATVNCWGGNSFGTVVPSSFSSESSLSGIKSIACGGKTLVAVDTSNQIAAIMGKDGYGVDSFSASDIGTAVLDVSVSFWGGVFIVSSTGAVSAWSQSATYATSSSSQSWYPSSDTQGCACTTASRSMALTAPSSGKFSMVACGGKRAGHFCCAVLASDDTTNGDTVQCFGDTNGMYTPTQSELSSQGLLAYSPYSISAGCDFLCVLTSSGQLGVYTHSSNQLFGYQSTWPVALSISSTGLDQSGTTYIQAACGTFAAYAIQADGSLAAYGRVFSSAVGPVIAGTDTTGTAASFTGYMQRVSSKSVSLLSANSGFGHACGVDTPNGGAGTCWGADYSSQVSDGNSITSIDTANIYPSTLGTTSLTAAPTGPTAAPTASANGVLRCASVHSAAATVTTAITLMLLANK